jgi:phage shock protein PspC (stress-responsive transcriptional regulator)
MTTTPPEAPSGPAADGPPPSDGGPRATRDEIRDLGRLRRSVDDRKVAGVAGGLARHLDVDPVILRVAFVVLVFFGGAGLIVYAACWLLVPEEGHPRPPLGLDDRSRSVALVIAGVVAAAALIGDSWGAFWFPWPLAVVALVALLLLTRRGHRGEPGPVTPPPGWPVGDPAAYGAPRGSAYDAPGGFATYDAPVTGSSAVTQAYAHQPYVAPAAVRRPPRRRGPILFWFTLALIALAEGVLGIVDLAGVDVAVAAYPALAVALTGVLLLVGAFYGRAGGLILVGLLSTGVLAVTTVAHEWTGTEVYSSPTRAADVHGHYRISGGELIVDLSGVVDPAALDGRTIHVRGDVGRLEVVVPAGVDTTAIADVNGPGDIQLFGRETGGIDIALRHELEAGAGAPTLTIDADLSVGQIEVHQ